MVKMQPDSAAPPTASVHPQRSASNMPNWSDSLDILRCIDCGGQVAAGDAGLTCESCQHTFPINDGMLVTSKEFDGNNKIAADFYDSPGWKKYRFWKFLTPFNERAVSKWRREVFQHLPNLENTRLLDVAIGAGLTVQLVPDSCAIHGLDISVQQLNDCRQNSNGRNVSLILGEAEHLPYADNSFDNVLSFGAFNYFSDPIGSLQEMARVVKPEGLIVITDEWPDIPNRMIGHRIGWPKLDRWILSRFLHLGDTFADLIEQHKEMKIEPLMEQVLTDWTIEQACNDMAYCVVGRAKK